MFMFKKFSLFLIRFYQRFLSLDQGLLGKLIPGHQVCIFTPTCSQYTYLAIEKYGIFKGGWMGIKRILRCGPWSKGGYDPVQ